MKSVSSVNIDDIISLTSKMVGVPSVEGTETAFDVLASYCAEILSACSHFERFECEGLPLFLWSNTKGGREFDLLLTGHLDVVPASTKDAFIPQIKNGRLHGRGSADMKGSCAAMVYAFQAITSFAGPNNIRLGLLLTCDEEVGGLRGARFACEELGIQSRITFLPDGGKWGKLCILQKGVMHIDLRTTGVSAHGARPWLGTSALDLILDDIRVLKTALLGESVQQSEWGYTVNVGKLHAGESTNSVPANALAGIDIRFGEDSSLLILRQTLARLPLQGQFTERVLAEAVTVNPASGDFVMFQSILKEHGLSGDTLREHGGSDACFFGQVSGSVIMTLPECSAFHIEDEWVDIQSLGLLCEMITEYARRLVSTEILQISKTSQLL
jgi:succinyl-diaminopimelate desuccinylase